MRRKFLDTEIRGAKPGEARNPSGKGGFKPGTSGNPAGRPVGRKRQIQIASAWDSFRESAALIWLHYALNYRLPKALEPLFTEGEEMTAAEKKELRDVLLRNYWSGMDFCRKLLSAEMTKSMDFSDAPSINEMLKIGQAKKSGKVVDLPVRKWENRS